MACFHATFFIVLSFTPPWSTDKSKAVIGGVTLVRTPSSKWELNSNWLTAGKEGGSIPSSRSWGEAFRDDTKRCCVADYGLQGWK